MDEYVNIVWYDIVPSDQIKTILSTIHYRIFLSTNIENLQKIINDDVHESEKILLVLSGNIDHELILDTVHNERRIVSIFILTDSFHSSLDKYNKICGIFHNYESLEKKLLLQARILNHQAITFDFDGKFNERSMEELLENPEISLLDIHSRFSSGIFITSDLKMKMLDYCRRHYITNITQLKLIGEFEKTYESKDALRWYSKDCFLFSSLNKCLRKQSGNVYDCDMVYFAVDLSMQIQLEWKKQRENKNATENSFHVYRGLNLPEIEITRIQQYTGKLITTKGFLSTTKSFAVAQMFAANVILDIEVDPKLENIIYADISSHSHIKDEEEVLIDFGTSFRIVDMEFYSEVNLWLMQLASVDEIDKVIESYIKFKRSQQEDDIIIASGLVFFGHKERAYQFLKESLETKTGNLDKMNLNAELAEMYAQSDQFKEAVDYLQEAHHICTLFYPYSIRLHSITFRLAMMYTCLNEHDSAFNYITIQLEFPNPKSYSLPRSCATSWSYLVTNEQTLCSDSSRSVYEYLQRCLIQFKQNKDICCKIHFNLSLILLKCDREAITLHSFDESLIHLIASGRLASSKFTNFLILYHYYMGVIYESKKCYNKAKRYYRKTITLLHSTCNASEKLNIMHVRIASCYAAQKIHKLAIEHYMKALELSLENDDSILIGKVRAHLGVLYLERKQYNEAVEQFLYVAPLSNIISRPFIDEIYLIIAETFLKENDTISAVKYYSAYLDRYEDKQEEFERWCDTCERIVHIYISENQCDSSIMCARKMLDYRVKNCSKDFDEIMNAQLLIALCYENNNQWKESIDYYQMAYDTLGKMTTDISSEEYNPLVSKEAVLIQSAVANLYQTTYDYEKSIYHANIALETEEKRQSRDKITIASCYDCIGWCYYKKREYDKALDFCTKCLHLLYTCVPEFDRRCCNIYHSLAAIWFELGNFKQSSTYCVKTIYILTTTPEFEEKEHQMLQHFYLLFELIDNRRDPAFPFEPFLNTADTQTMSIAESNFENEIEERPNSLLEDEIHLILSSIIFRVIDSFDTGDSLHNIILQDTHSPSSAPYPRILYISANKHLDGKEKFCFSFLYILFTVLLKSFLTKK